ncbi:MAG TPA: hypothetical protein VJ997_01420 [Longimicrobiales bacterium]|nr:hypothetical protein [Longimicrobiales bacterium]
MNRSKRTLTVLSFAVAGTAGLVTLAAPAGASWLGRADDPSTHATRTEGAASTPTETGQAAFAAISEIVAILQADPATDWSRVDIAALRDHLVDMDRVTMGAQVVQRPIENGVEMTVGGTPAVMDAARRMVRAHAAMVGGGRGWNVDVQDEGDALRVSWTTPRPEEVVKLRALGFYGFLVDGSHHQQHHLMIARGMDPHGAGMR